jgi:hypothetical protein
VGLFSGYLLDNATIVLLVTVAANATLYYLALRFTVWIWAKVR